jgi:hypothetical protein
MLKNRAIAIASTSALLALSQVDAAPAATPLATIRVAATHTHTQHITHPPRDFDRAFITQQTGETRVKELHTGNFSARPSGSIDDRILLRPTGLPRLGFSFPLRDE